MSPSVPLDQFDAKPHIYLLRRGGEGSQNEPLNIFRLIWRQPLVNVATAKPPRRGVGESLHDETSADCEMIQKKVLQNVDAHFACVVHLVFKSSEISNVQVSGESERIKLQYLLRWFLIFIIFGTLAFLSTWRLRTTEDSSPQVNSQNCKKFQNFSLVASSNYTTNARKAKPCYTIYSVALPFPTASFLLGASTH